MLFGTSKPGLCRPLRLSTAGKKAWLLRFDARVGSSRRLQSSLEEAEEEEASKRKSKPKGSRSQRIGRARERVRELNQQSKIKSQRTIRTHIVIVVREHVAMPIAQKEGSSPASKGWERSIRVREVTGGREAVCLQL